MYPRKVFQHWFNTHNFLIHKRVKHELNIVGIGRRFSIVDAILIVEERSRSMVDMYACVQIGCA